MNRVVVVLATASTDALALAMLEDVVDLVHAMQQVEAALAVPPYAGEQVTDVAWPGMPVLHPAGAALTDVLDAAAGLGATEASVVCADAPDLPALLIGKMHSALTAADVAVCPADGGGFVAVAARLAAPAWLRGAAITLDDADGLDRLRAAAPSRRLSIGAGWHRVRAPGDVERLDRGLEGWEATRALLDAR